MNSDFLRQPTGLMQFLIANGKSTENLLDKK